MGLPLLIGASALIKGIGSILGGHKQASAAGDASRIMTDYGNRGVDAINAERQRATGMYSPYTAGGMNAMTTLGALMTPGQRLQGNMVSPTAGGQGGPVSLWDLMQSGGRMMPQGGGQSPYGAPPMLPQMPQRPMMGGQRPMMMGQ